MAGQSSSDECEGMIFYDLGELGSVAKLKLGKAPEREDKLKWGDIVVLDVSGSMGGTVRKIVTKALPGIYKELGLSKTDPIHEVLFESKTHYTVTNWEAQMESKRDCMGGTYMHGAILKVKEILEKEPSTPFRILVISDGDISDKDQVLDEASKLQDALTKAGRTAPVSVCQIRAMTSSYANPDTQAMASLGQLNFSGTISMIEVTQYGIETQMTPAVIDAFVKGGSAGSNFHLIGCKDSILRLPASETISEMQVTEGDTQILLKAGTKPQDVLVNGKSLPAEKIKVETATEEHLLPLLLFVESQVKQLMVLGKSDAKVKDILQWTSKVADRITKNDEKEEQQEGEITNKASIILRRRQLLAAVTVVQTTVLQRLKELQNAEKVSSLNSARQAEFLRGVGSGAMGKALAKRAGKVDAGVPDEIVPEETKKLISHVKATPLTPVANEAVSFYSRDTLTSVLNGLTEVTSEQLDALPASDIMKFVGPIGITFRAKQNDAPDPWSCFFAEEVYVGDHTLLNAADLWTSKSLSGGELDCPGTGGQKISGVLPVRSLNPEGFDLMMNQSPNLLKLHVAASLRGSLVAMPGDLGAIASSCAVKLAESFVGQPLKATAKALLMLLNDLTYYGKETYEMGIKAEIRKVLNEGDPRTVLAGDVNIASELKPFGGVLAGTVFPTPELAKALLGYSLYLQFNRKYSDPEERRKTIESLLGVDESRDLKPGAAFSPDPEKVFSKEFNREKFRTIAGDNILKSVSAVFAARDAFEQHRDNVDDFSAEFQRILNEDGKNGIVPKFFGVETLEEVKDLAGASALQSLLTPNLSSRVDVDESAGTRTFKLPELTDVATALKYVESEVETVYEQRYERALKQKREEERVASLERLVQKMVEEKSLETFISLFETTAPGVNRPLIAGRMDGGFETLCNQLIERVDAPERFNKLWVLILGRNLEAEPVWLQGNSMRTNLAKFQKVFVDAGEKDKWEELREIHSRFCKHTYREGGIPNRHGHSNDLPSWWALGYATLDDYQKDKPEEAEKYIQERLKQGHLWANPKYRKGQNEKKK